MDGEKRAYLESQGYVVYDDAADFLGLSAEVRSLIDLRDALGRAVRRARLARRLNLTQAARVSGTGRDALAWVEAGGPGAPLEEAFRFLFLLGGRPEDVLASEAREKPEDVG